jgi:Uma2 family endonuclease
VDVPMSTAVVIPVEEYLSTSYEPDCEYVNGRLVERNVGEYEHSVIQGAIIEYLGAVRRKLNIKVLPEQRLRLSVSPPRYRIADVCALDIPQRRTSVVLEPPLLVIKILSPEDSMSRVSRKLKEYIAFGVKNVWLVDPDQRTIAFADLDGIHEMRDRKITLTSGADTAIIDFNEIFAELD